MSESFSGLPAAFEGKQVHSSFCQVGAYVSQRQPMTIELGHSSEWSRGMTSGWKCVVLWVKKKDRTLRCRHFGNLERCFPELGSINKISQTLGHAKRELKKVYTITRTGTGSMDPELLVRLPTSLAFPRCWMERVGSGLERSALKVGYFIDF